MVTYTHRSLFAGRNSRVIGRATLAALAFSTVAIAFLLFVGFSPGWDLPRIVQGAGSSKTVDLPPPPPVVQPKIPLCDDKMSRSGVAEFLQEAEAKYAKLRDDKFTYVPCFCFSTFWSKLPLLATMSCRNVRTNVSDQSGISYSIAIQTYRRPYELNTTLTTILSSPDVPSLHEVVVVWNNLDETPPPDFKSEHGVPVRYRRSQRNSLNEKLRPDPDFQTQAILLSDDDVFYYPSDLEFVFQTWRKFGRDRLVGGLPRCADVSNKGDWRYSTCSKKEDEYSMIITNLAFAHVKFLDYYTLAEDEVTRKIRAHVDEHFNCEDIGMNFVTAMLTRSGPLLARGRREYHNFAPRMSISGKPGHLVARSRCLNMFAELVGCMPLVNETARIERGVVRRPV